MSSYAKNIKRNATRPTASMRPYSQSMYKNGLTDREMKKVEKLYKEGQELMEKVRSWNNL